MQLEMEDLTIQIDELEESHLVDRITRKFDNYESARSSQIADLAAVRNSIYEIKSPVHGAWDSKVDLPNMYELAQTLKAHITQNVYSHPETMFDVSGTSEESQAFANKQKAMLVKTFEEMNFELELEKIVNGIVEAGEATLFVGWDTKVKRTRRAQTFEEKLLDFNNKGFVIEEKVVYDNAKIKYIHPEDFVFDKYDADNWDSCSKIYRTYKTLDEIRCDKSNNYLNEMKLEDLKGVVAKNSKRPTSFDNNKLEVFEFLGDIELKNGKTLKNWFITVAGRKHIIRFESNPFVINPFIHANIIENPATGRGISPIRVALVLNDISSEILNKQLDALALTMNPPYLAPKGCFRGQQNISPGKIIEYDAALMPTTPTPLNFDKAMVGWDFLNYFKTTIEREENDLGLQDDRMSGNIQDQARTATELNYSASGQESRLNMILEEINRKIIIPAVEKTADIIANFKLGKETIAVNEHGQTSFIEIDDSIRNANYIYRYGDRKATFERKNRFKELFEVVQAFAQVDVIAQNIDWLECFKFALEQYGIENVNNFLLDKDTIS